jgi:hypothetical protein
MLTTDFPISFYITKYDLTKDRFEELLNESVHCEPIMGLEYGTYLRRVEFLHFMESYSDWLADEIFMLEDGEINRSSTKRFAHAGQRRHA